MIKYQENTVEISHDQGLWSAEHTMETAAGPQRLQIGDDILVQDVDFYIGDLTPDCAVLDKFRAYHRGGAAVVEAKGVFPFGNEIRFSQVCRYAANHMRVTFDFNWPRATEVKRHLGLGSLFLPGQWQRFLVVPPVACLGAAAKPAWREIDEAATPGTMLAHWHRAPLAVVFERRDGTRLEVGTGSDLWRWENGFGAGSEGGSYKIRAEAGGVRFIREPLMTCMPFVPAARQYRFNWYMAWTNRSFPEPLFPAATETLAVAENRKLEWPEGTDPEQTTLLLDLQSLSIPPVMRKMHSVPDFIRGKTATTACWESNAANKLLRSLLRQIAARAEAGNLRIKGMLPQTCFVPGHVGRQGENGVAHWDMGAILDLQTWVRRQLGENWNLRLDNRLVDLLPSLQGIELANGFDPDEVLDVHSAPARK